MRGALTLAREVKTRRLSAETVVRAVLADIAARDKAFNACAAVMADDALAEALRVDAALAAGRDPGPLAGVPFLAKANFDVAGYVTLAGSPARASLPPAAADAFAVAQLRRAGAVLIGTTHMDELACGATGENPHFGAVHLPHDTTRMTGGSSSGSAAAVAAGFVPLALGSDTNGSIRAPAALCGVWGVKPTNGRLSRGGCVPYANTLDVVGGFANHVDDLAMLYNVMQGYDATDRSHAREPVTRIGEDAASRPRHPMRVGVLTGYFETFADANARRAVRRAAACFDAVTDVAIDAETIERVRDAAMIVSNVEVAAAHEALLAGHAAQCSPRLRTRLLAGSLSPAIWYGRALAWREQWQALIGALFDWFDVLLAPATPYAAPRFGTAHVDVGGVAMAPAKTLGMLTQPISFAGLPVVTAPVFDAGELPLGVQLIAAPWREDHCFAAARRIEGQRQAHFPAYGCVNGTPSAPA
ncbi:AtzE family amidohydrolase [Pandoraea terrae]|nr:AtzE family amidohydrolase [Pandoraea terrae]